MVVALALGRSGIDQLLVVLRSFAFDCLAVRHVTTVVVDYEHKIMSVKKSEPDMHSPTAGRSGSNTDTFHRIQTHVPEAGRSAEQDIEVPSLPGIETVIIAWEDCRWYRLLDMDGGGLSPTPT